MKIIDNNLLLEEKFVNLLPKLVNYYLFVNHILVFSKPFISYLLCKLRNYFDFVVFPNDLTS